MEKIVCNKGDWFSFQEDGGCGYGFVLNGEKEALLIREYGAGLPQTVERGNVPVSAKPVADKDSVEQGIQLALKSAEVVSSAFEDRVMRYFSKYPSGRQVWDELESIVCDRFWRLRSRLNKFLNHYYRNNDAGS